MGFFHSLPAGCCGSLCNYGQYLQSHYQARQNFPGRQKRAWVCRVIPVLTPLGICQLLEKYWTMSVRCEELWHKPTSAATLCLKGATLSGNKSLSLHLRPHFFLVPIFCCPFYPVLYWKSPERASQASSTAWSVWREKNPTARGQPKRKQWIQCGDLHQHHSMAPLPQQHPPAQTAREGNVPFLFVRWKAKQLIQGLRRWGNAEFQQFISNFSSSASTSAYLRPCRVRQCTIGTSRSGARGLPAGFAEG